MPILEHSTPIPTDEELSFVHPSPKKAFRKELVNSKDILHLMMRPMTGLLQGVSVKYYENGGGKSYEVKILSNSTYFQLDKKMVVRHDKTNEPIAVMIQKGVNLATNWKIYGFQPFGDDQNQAPSKTHKFEGKDLYKWAKCKPGLTREYITTQGGTEYIVAPVGKRFAMNGSYRIALDDKPCCYFDDTKNGLSIKIGPGIDPVLMVCYAAAFIMNQEAAKAFAENAAIYGYAGDAACGAC